MPGEEPEKPWEKKKADGKKGDPAPAAADTQTKVAVKAMSPSNVGVRILNGTSTSGLAAFASEQMTPEGFEIRGIADSSQHVEETVVRYGPGQRAAAATVAHMFPGAKIQPDRSVKSGVELILGSDFTDVDDPEFACDAGHQDQCRSCPHARLRATCPATWLSRTPETRACD